PYWKQIDELLPARVHIGYVRAKGERAGRWIERRYTPETKWPYRIATLGYADDPKDSANGESYLSYEQALAKIKVRTAAPRTDSKPIDKASFTVRQAMDYYITKKERKGQPVNDLKSRSNTHIMPTLGDKKVAELTSDDLDRRL